MRRTIPTLAIVATVTVSVAFAASHAETPREVKARQGLMNIISINFGTIGDMVRGKDDYDAATAQAAADSLVGVGMIQHDNLWPEPTLGIDGSRALTEIGEDRAGFLAIWDRFDTAAAGLQAVAGGGIEGLGGAVGELGQVCKACHDDYRLTR
ncbi:Cytochrome c556 [Jannaschia faecimaris]|uniref:Cytochrome c556 n=1 Tax=Jannaschia faecimaris TaxID=1244108 RepID=A0A1H3P6H1_9RHOB|nr:cytochrome c [Jannaschia faecimaris]SDY95969.1 Cytochrome c556 [Jannaschia faecimaris]